MATRKEWFCRATTNRVQGGIVHQLPNGLEVRIQTRAGATQPWTKKALRAVVRDLEAALLFDVSISEVKAIARDATIDAQQ